MKFPHKTKKTAHLSPGKRLLSSLEEMSSERIRKLHSHSTHIDHPIKIIADYATLDYGICLEQRLNDGQAELTNRFRALIRLSEL